MLRKLLNLFKKKKKKRIEFHYHCPNCGKNPFSGMESPRVVDDDNIVHVLCAKCGEKYAYGQISPIKDEWVLYNYKI